MFMIILCTCAKFYIRKHQDLGRLKMIHMPLVRLEHISMILQCTVIRFQSRLIIILFCMYTSKWFGKWNKFVILCIYPAESKYWGMMCRRLKSLNLLVDTNVIGIQEQDQIHNLSYNLQTKRLRWSFPGKFVLLPDPQIISYKGCVNFSSRSFLSRFFSNPERRYNHVFGTTQLPQLGVQLGSQKTLI